MSPAAAGQNSFAVLLFQDLAVIPILAVFPLLAAAGAVAPDAHGGAPASTWTAGLQGWAQTLAVVATVGAVIAAGRILVRPAFRFIACARCIDTARERIQDLERTLLDDLKDVGLERDAGWDAESLRRDFDPSGETPVPE